MPILWAPGKITFFLQENLHAHKIPRFRGGFGVFGFFGGFWGFGGEGSADKNFYGREDFSDHTSRFYWGWGGLQCIWCSAKVSHKTVFALSTPEKPQLEMVKMLQNPVLALPGCQQISVNIVKLFFSYSPPPDSPPPPPTPLPVSQSSSRFPVDFESFFGRFRVDCLSRLKIDSKTTRQRLENDRKTTRDRLENDWGRWWWRMSPGVGCS